MAGRVGDPAPLTLSRRVVAQKACTAATWTEAHITDVQGSPSPSEVIKLSGLGPPPAVPVARWCLCVRPSHETHGTTAARAPTGLSRVLLRLAHPSFRRGLPRRCARVARAVPPPRSSASLPAIRGPPRHVWVGWPPRSRGTCSARTALRRPRRSRSRCSRSQRCSMSASA